MDSKKLDSFVNPKHYAKYSVNLMPIDFIEELPYNLASACKYLFRLGKKDNAEIEIGKINWYLTRALERNEYVKVPKYLYKLAPNGLDLNISIIRAIASGKGDIVENLRWDLTKEYVENVTKDNFETETEEPKVKRTLNKSGRAYNLYINNKYFFNFFDKGMLFSHAPIEEGNDEIDDLDVVPYRVWKYLEELGWEQSGCDRNGWEMDFYISFKKEGEPKLQLRGSGMYGGLYFYLPGAW